jgi:hypothetical protein
MVAAPGQTNTLAVVSLVSALVAPFAHFTGIGGLTLTIVSIVTGHMARRQIRQTGERGDGFALAGLIISYVHLALTALVLIFFFGAIIAAIAFILAAATGHEEGSASRNRGYHSAHGRHTASTAGDTSVHAPELPAAAAELL